MGTKPKHGQHNRSGAERHDPYQMCMVATTTCDDNKDNHGLVMCVQPLAGTTAMTVQHHGAIVVGYVSFAQRYSQDAAKNRRNHLNKCRPMALNSYCDMHTTQKANLRVRECVAVIDQHSARVLPTTVTKQCGYGMDQFIIEVRARTMTITPTHAVQTQPLH